MPRKAKEPIKRTSVWLTKAQLASLKRITEHTGIPSAFLIRQGVDWVIQQHTTTRGTVQRRAR